MATAEPVCNTVEDNVLAGALNEPSRPHEKPDIEHVQVTDDPRQWSRARKYMTLATVASAALIATLGVNIYNPAIPQIQQDLNASSGEIALSLSLFIIFQGNSPLFWSALTEIYGRKKVYIISVLIFIVGCVIVATATSIGIVIGFRCLQAFGASAVLTIGAATLADIFEPHERGSMMGIYYAAPLLGPALGPLIGGVVTQLFNWRATFWCLVIFGFISLLTFIIFKDTFRRERSLAYQAALARIRKQTEQRASKRSSQITIVSPSERKSEAKSERDVEEKDLEAQIEQQNPSADTKDGPKEIEHIKLSLRDINPIGPLIVVVRRRNNVAILFASSLLFAFSYSISYTCSRTFAMFYDYNALQIGLVLLSFGLGCMGGSLLGGRWSDKVLQRLRAKNGGQSYPEMRLQSTVPAFFFLPISTVAYAWLCEKRVNVVAICFALFFAGFFTIWIYSSTLAYIVDANVGRSSTAVASNSAFRGTAGFIASEVAAPLQDAIGDGGLYTIWAGLLILSELIILLVIWKGGEWREEAQAREARAASFKEKRQATPI